MTIITTYPWESKVIPITSLEGERTLLETLGQSLHLLSTDFHRGHGRHPVPLWYLYLL